MHLAPKGGWGPQVTLVWPARPGWVARLKLIERITDQVFQQLRLDQRKHAPRGKSSERAPRKKKSQGCELQRSFIYDRFRFSLFHCAHSHLQVGGFFAFKAFPLTVANVNREPLRTLSRGLYAPPHAAAADYSRSESFRPFRRLRLLTQTGQACCAIRLTVDSDSFSLAF